MLAEHAGELFAPPDPLGDAVQLMTIHKAKGLEFDTVIVPGLQRITGGDDNPLLLWDEVAGPDGSEHLLAAPIKAKGAGGDGPTAYDYLRRLEAERAGHEAERVLYVAATRAIRRLHLIGVAEADAGKEDGIKPPARGSLLDLLWDGVARPLFVAALADADRSPAPAPAIDPAAFEPPLVRLAAPGIPAALRQLPPGPRAAANPLDLDDAGSAPSLEAAIGTLVHRCLELIAKSGTESWPETRIAALEPAWRRWLAGHGHSCCRSSRRGRRSRAGGTRDARRHSRPLAARRPPASRHRTGMEQLRRHGCGQPRHRPHFRRRRLPLDHRLQDGARPGGRTGESRRGLPRPTRTLRRVVRRRPAAAAQGDLLPATGRAGRDPLTPLPLDEARPEHQAPDQRRIHQAE